MAFVCLTYYWNYWPLGLDILELHCVENGEGVADTDFKTFEEVAFTRRRVQNLLRVSE
jgi:hypothetical protein